MTFSRPKRYVASVDCIDLDELYRSGKRVAGGSRQHARSPRRRLRLSSIAIWLDRARRLVFAFVLCLITGTAARSSFCPRACIDHVIWCASEASALCFVGGAACFRQRARVPSCGRSALYGFMPSRLAGIDSILVKPQTHVDMWYTYAFRFFERRALRDLPCEEGGHGLR